MDPDITQLAKMMCGRRAAGVAPYTLLLGSSLSLTPAVRRAVCDSEDWEAFWETVSRTSLAERRALMHGPLSQLDLQAGCEALAQLVGAGDQMQSRQPSEASAPASLATGQSGLHGRAQAARCPALHRAEPGSSAAQAGG